MKLLGLAEYDEVLVNSCDSSELRCEAAGQRAEAGELEIDVTIRLRVREQGVLL